LAVVIGAALTSTTGITAMWLVVAVGACAIPALSGHGSGLGLGLFHEHSVPHPVASRPLNS
jgi:hypothetical protein